MYISRLKLPKGSHTTKARTFVAAMVVALTMTSMSQVNAAYAPIAGVRGHQLTIPLDPPSPLDGNAADAGSCQHSARSV